MSDSYYDSDLLCEYCSTNFDLQNHVPKVLGVCGHNLCAECIASLGETRGFGRLMCPFCRQPHRPGEISVNPVIVNLLRSAAAGILGDDSSTINGVGGSAFTEGGYTNSDDSDDDCDARSDTFDEDASWSYKWYEERGKWWFCDYNKDRRWHYFGTWGGNWKDLEEWKTESGQAQSTF
ncbi:hypothetical protein Pmar_PMAR023678 [Perkinsus marinus ATCC 50983]|uniref:RING-type domain-containing protein n=1 Tax=Perkinsus marinus (strain ATCC 50983 / TXsc) TaxID=423536 RepID=C5KD02_PERM5|nr:hypothetical protein Pmar_PMAR023678 [Perkinsus marinus ATCC 50983]EER17751.1 hypothetical protein Pmar_PMAR023678 [Perkinsus marinus ATCC 50983]|eukprot:XP_002785955.1 hypothetical protein Pmar_PMAR023678 [Perkinsus marinus ATCC 50983]